MSDIFLSYDNEDHQRVLPIVREMEAQGWSVFWDRNIPPGMTWPKVLERELTSARCVVVIWSQHSIGSEWVYEEAEVGKQHQCLIPVLIDSVQPPMGFRGIQAANLVGWNETPGASGFQQLIGAVKTRSGPGRPGPVPAPEFDAFRHRLEAALDAGGWERLADPPPPLIGAFRKTIGVFPKQVHFIGIIQGDGYTASREVKDALKVFFEFVGRHSEWAELMTNYTGLLLMAFGSPGSAGIREQCRYLEQNAVLKRVFTCVGVYDLRAHSYLAPSTKFAKPWAPLMAELVGAL